MDDPAGSDISSLCTEADAILELATAWCPGVAAQDGERVETYMRACRELVHASLLEGFRRGRASAARSRGRNDR